MPRRSREQHLGLLDSLHGDGIENRIRARRKRQSFVKWNLDSGHLEGSCLNLLGALHSKNDAGSYGYNRLEMKDTLVLHYGVLSAWFFVSKQTGRLLCKNRSSLVVDEILEAFSSCEVHEPEVQPKNRKVAVLYRGGGSPAQYLTETDLANLLHHRTTHERCILVQKLGPYNNDEFSVLHATWNNGHCMVDGKRFDAETSPFSHIRVEERMKAMDAFLDNWVSGIRADPKEFAYVTESWVGAKVVSRLRAMCSGIVAHIEQVCKSHAVKKFRCFFKLGLHNQLTFLFPVELKLHPLKPPQAIMDKVASATYRERQVTERFNWHLRRDFKKKEPARPEKQSEGQREKVTESTAANEDPLFANMRQSLDNMDAGETEGQDKTREEAADKCIQENLLPTVHSDPSSKNQVGRGAERAESSVHSVAGKGSGTRRTTAKADTRKRPSAPRENRRRAVNPVRKLLLAYGSSASSAQHMDEWWTQRQKLDRVAERKRLAALNQTKSLLSPKIGAKGRPVEPVSPQDHAKLLNDIRAKLHHEVAILENKSAKNSASNAVSSLGSPQDKALSDTPGQEQSFDPTVKERNAPSHSGGSSSSSSSSNSNSNNNNNNSKAVAATIALAVETGIKSALSRIGQIQLKNRSSKLSKEMTSENVHFLNKEENEALRLALQ